MFVRICQELFERLFLQAGAPGVTCDPGNRDRSRPTRIARRRVSVRPMLLSNVSTCLWEQQGNTKPEGAVTRALNSLSSTGLCFQRDLRETWRAVCVGNYCMSFFESFVSFGWPCLKANAINVCSIINNVQMVCSFFATIYCSVLFWSNILHAVQRWSSQLGQFRKTCRCTHGGKTALCCFFFACSCCHVLLLA